MRPQSTKPNCICIVCGTTFCRPPSRVKAGRIRFCSSACYHAWDYGANSARWTGERQPIRMPNGYLLEHAPDHPKANKRGYVRQHILVAERLIGRYLALDECVHHLNGVRDDNRPTNLTVMTKLEHNRLHARERRAAHSQPSAPSTRR